MKKYALLSCLALPFYASLAAAQVNPARFEKQAFQKDVKEYFDLLQLPGISVAVVYHGQIVFRQMEGYADIARKRPIADDDIFPIASVTKTFTAAMMMQYVQEKKISLDDYILDYPFIGIRFGWPYNIDANVRIKDLLSHVSEQGDPGTTYNYNGSRFNFVYGVFERITGQTENPKAYPQELSERIFKPLQLASTMAGVPDTADARFRRMVTPYLYDTASRSYTVDSNSYHYTTAYPATGILTSIGDLAAYTTSLDNNTLMTAESYRKMTTPYVLSGGETSPYATGWFSEEVAGHRLHWHWGFGDSFAALLLRVPDTGLTLIVLSNSTNPSASVRLNYGHVMQSLLAISFLKHFVMAGEFAQPRIDYSEPLNVLRQQVKRLGGREKAFAAEELMAQALARNYANRQFHTDSGKAAQLTQLLYEIDPARFNSYNPALTYLVTRFPLASLRDANERLIGQYEKSGHILPELNQNICTWYEKMGEADKAIPFYRRLADSRGYEVTSYAFSAYTALGKYYFANGNVPLGRKYLWAAVNELKMAGYDDKGIQKQIDLMHVK